MKLPLRLLASLIFVAGVILPISLSHAQPHGGGGGAGGGGGMNALFGRVVDRDLDQPIPYATILLFSAQDSTQVTGTVSGEDGTFLLTSIPPGEYYTKISFIGYEPVYRDGLRIRPGGGRQSLGEVGLRQAALEMDEVSYVIERSPVEFQIDKKVVHVAKQATSASGTAVDVLENVPSVSVDIEGNLSLRGSGNFTVLIDGRPTILDPNDALQQIPAGSIETIEIITNPSAKYDPEGTAGILNVILKKERRDGTSGLVNVDVGHPQRYGVDALMQQKWNGYTLTLGGDYNVRRMPGGRHTYTRTNSQGVTTTTLSEGEMSRNRDSYGVRGSIDGNLSSRDWLSVGGRIGAFTGGHVWDQTYTVGVDTLPTATRYSNESLRDREDRFSSAYVEYRHQFGARRGHELTARLQGNWSQDETSTENELIDATGVLRDGRRSTESGPSNRADARLEYVHPFGEKGKFETGYNLQMHSSEEETKLSEYSVPDGHYVDLPQFYNTVLYDRSIHAIYAIYGNQWGRFGAQAGMRGEYTDRSVELKQTGETFTIDRMDAFPSLHLSYDWGGEFQTMTSYSRRIDRPRGWFLQPFETWMDAYNVRKGNPDILPEYIDSYELGYQTPLGPFHHSAEVYYRRTDNLVEFRRMTHSPGVTLNMPENVGVGHALGTEIMFTGDLTRQLNANLMGNFYNNRIEVPGGAEKEDFSWSSRLSLTWKLPMKYRFQANGIYNSPVVSSQGRSEEFFMINSAVQKSFAGDAMTLIFNVRDIFGTAKHTRITEGSNLYSRMEFDRFGPSFGLTLRYNFNHYPEKRRGQNGNGDMSGGDEFME